MKKAIVLVLLGAFTTLCAHAQTKIFKEVGEEISSQMRTIRQDNTLVGYMVFTQLEKASEDSFNYKVTIMDENLNDIGTVNFRDRNMTLQDVSFEQDVLCVAYLKGSFAGDTKPKKKKEYKEALENKDNEVFIQYISLDGKILKTNSFPVAITLSSMVSGAFAPRITTYGYLKHSVQLKNIAKKGFACFYGDEKSNNLLVFNTKGNVLWQKIIAQQADYFYMLTAERDIYLLGKTASNVTYKPGWHFGNNGAVVNEGGYQLYGYSTRDTTVELNYPLKDDRFNKMGVLTFENDLVTGKPYLAGLFINEKKDECTGAFTINVNGVGNNQINTVSTYWENNPIGSDEENRAFQKRMEHTSITNAFRDFSGNTCFTASTYFAGCELIKQNTQGKLALETNILSERTLAFRPGPSPREDEKNFYRLFNTDTKTSYLVVDDPKNISIYNIDQKKVLRTIPHKDGSIKTYVYPAKEGYVMISEYNKKEKYTKLSIEAL